MASRNARPHGLGFLESFHEEELPRHRGNSRGFLREAREAAREGDCQKAIRYLVNGAAWAGAGEVHALAKRRPGKEPARFQRAWKSALDPIVKACARPSRQKKS